MEPIVIEGYLDQQKLESSLKQIVGVDCWRGREVRLPIGRRRWDMSYSTDDQTSVVEFDGDEHYRNALRVKADREKDTVAVQHGIRVIRVPYWVQLTSETLQHYFCLQAEVQQDFPHGFITTKIFPASFCPLGISRFRRELLSLPPTVREAVRVSVTDRAEEHGRQYVVPVELNDVL